MKKNPPLQDFQEIRTLIREDKRTGLETFSASDFPARLDTRRRIPLPPARSAFRLKLLPAAAALLAAAALIFAWRALRAPDPFETSVAAIGRVLAGTSAGRRVSAAAEVPPRPLTSGDEAFARFRWSLVSAVSDVHLGRISPRDLPDVLARALRGSIPAARADALFGRRPSDRRQRGGGGRPIFRPPAGIRNLIQLILNKLQEV